MAAETRLDAKTPRRTSVKGHPGVYYRVGRDGKRQYEISYRDESGRKRFQRVPGTLDSADQALAGVKAMLRKGAPVRPAERTVAEVWELWKAIRLPRLRPSTAKLYEQSMKNYVLPKLGTVKVQRISAGQLATWITELQADGLKAWTIRGAITPFRQTLSYAVRERLIAENPFSHLEANERPASDESERRILTKTELTTLFGKAAERYRLALQLLAFSGLRSSEFLALRWNDLDLQAGTISVRFQLDDDGQLIAPKTKKAKRTIYLMERLARKLKAHKLASPHSDPTDFVFVRDEGQPWTYNGLHAGFKAAYKRANLVEDGKPTPTLHGLRHGYGSMLVADGCDPVFVQRQLGHANAAITLRIYAHEFGAAEAAKRMTDSLEKGYGDALG
jgi:integrase